MPTRDRLFSRGALALSLVTATLIASVAFAQPKARVGKPFDGRVVRIADGDTFEILADGERQSIRIRLHGVDAPELGEVYSRDALLLMRTLLLDQRVQIDGRDVDRYGRLVARVAVGGKDASTELLRAGLACQRFATDTVLAAVEATARAAAVGFWARNAAKPECVARAQAEATAAAGRLRGPRSRDRSSGAPRVSDPPADGARRSTDTGIRYRANVSSGLYHASTCPNFACRNCTREFATEAEAVRAGFKPSADCVSKR